MSEVEMLFFKNCNNQNLFFFFSAAERLAACQQIDVPGRIWAACHLLSYIFLPVIVDLSLCRSFSGISPLQPSLKCSLCLIRYINQIIEKLFNISLATHSGLGKPIIISNSDIDQQNCQKESQEPKW
jgi:hypothetical protein